jgi:hypothetical protein
MAQLHEGTTEIEIRWGSQVYGAYGATEDEGKRIIVPFSFYKIGLPILKRFMKEMTND